MTQRGSMDTCTQEVPSGFILCESQNDLQYYRRWLLDTPEIPTYGFSGPRILYF